MGLKKFQLIWVDGVDATYPDVETDGRQKKYVFEVETAEDAEQFARSFMMINSEHDFSDHSLREIK